MANREELLVIRAARAGHAAAQLALGKRYLFGGAGLPKNSATALYWLDRAAQQDVPDAWILIGSHIPFETAQHAAQSAKLCFWYERAFDAGVIQAGLVLAKLVLAQRGSVISELMRHKALLALKAAAYAGIADAQWLLAQQIERANTVILHGNGEANPVVLPAGADQDVMLEWAARAASGGIEQARRALAAHAWATADNATFLRWSLPLAREIAGRPLIADSAPSPLPAEDAVLLSRCAQALFITSDLAAPEIEQFWKLAAEAGDRNAQFSLGLWLGRIGADGSRIDAIPGLANYKKSIRWLTLAGEQGIAEAWYAISKIYLKPEFSRRNLCEAQHFLERAAKAGHCIAQLESGIAAWRARGDAPSNEVRAVYWLQKAAAQGSMDAQALLEKIASHASPAAWAVEAKHQLTRDLINVYPFLSARIELAALFGLTRAEALLLDLNAADRGHCLVVDIRGQHPRSRRRLIQVQMGEQRDALNRIMRLFEDVDSGPVGPEGNYRQRLYRLKSLLRN